MTVAIIGSGFWGVAVALTLQERGEEVVVLDSREPLAASSKAAGVINWEWFSKLLDASDAWRAGSSVYHLLPAWWNLESSLKSCIEYVERHTDYCEFPEQITSYSGKRHRGRACHLVSPWIVLESIEANAAQAERLERRKTGGWSVVCRSGSTHDFDAVVVTAGAWSDTLLSRSGIRPAGVSPLPGRALVLDLEVAGVRTHFVNRFSQYTLRPWRDGTSRLGDSVERAVRSKARDTLYRMRDLLAPGGQVVNELYGWRPVTGKFHVERHAPGLIVATGGHRVGLAVSGAVADRVYTLLREKD